ncbi:MAG: LacI family DNA-binding transcriptional regulator [Lachnospiraceae bacterium]|nr:LacI family DNA-binding transcriptional regulator [Lachnospiraceae bacterium]
MPEITIKDIAKQCGVGISTVSRAINNHPDINSETKEMVMRVIRENGFVPNNSARNLKRTEAKCIAVLVKGITNPFFSNMIKMIEEETQKKNYSMVLKHVEYYEDEVDAALQLEKEKRLKGIIFLGGAFIHSDEKISNLHIPYIFSTVGNAIPQSISKASYSDIAVDDRKESFRMTEYLIGLGHKDIAILTAESEIRSIGQLRLSGYKEALVIKGIPVKDELIRNVVEDIEHYSMENGYLTTKKLLEDKVPFTAIYATSDSLAVGACRALTEAGRRIPEDVSVVGFDGSDIGRYYNPGITTMKQPVEEMAYATINLLFDIITGQKQNEHIVFEAELIERESSGIAAR